MTLLPRLIAVVLCLGAGSGFAMFKVVAPDGSVTYTDRPPANPNGRVVTLGRNTDAQAPEPVLPLDLRQAMQRFPVTLYTAPDCTPCDNGRTMLQQRGVPYTERRILDNADALALDRVVGGRTVPALAVGAQPLRGYSPDEWGAYLDAAGYPRESRLPRGWQPPAPTPLAPRRAAAAPEAEPAPPPPAAPEQPAVVPGSIRF